MVNVDGEGECWSILSYFDTYLPPDRQGENEKGDDEGGGGGGEECHSHEPQRGGEAQKK